MYSCWDVTGVSRPRPPRPHQQHMPDAQLSCPVPLEHVDADFAIGSHIWVKDLGQEVALGWGCRKVLPQQKLHTEQASSIWGPLCSVRTGTVSGGSGLPGTLQTPKPCLPGLAGRLSALLPPPPDWGLLKSRMGPCSQGSQDRFHPSPPPTQSPVSCPTCFTTKSRSPSLNASSFLPSKSPSYTPFPRGRHSPPIVFLEKHLLRSLVGK